MLSRHFKSLLSSPQKTPSLSKGFASAEIVDVSRAEKELETASCPLHLETFDVPRLELHDSDINNHISETDTGVHLVDPRYSNVILFTADFRDKVVGTYRETAEKISSYAATFASEIGSGKSENTKVNTVSDSGPRLATSPFDKAGIEQKWESVKQQLPGWQTKIAEALQTVQDMITKPKGGAAKKDEDCSK